MNRARTAAMSVLVLAAGGAGCWTLAGSDLASGTPPGPDAASQTDGAGLVDGTTADTGVGPSEAAPACAADLLIDAQNCGRCGHDCARGECVAGRCQAIALTSSEIDLEELRTTADRLVYRAKGQVRTVSIDGGLPSVLACATRTGLAVRDTSFYSWCDNLATLRDVVDAGVLANIRIDGYGAATGGDWFLFRENNQYLSRISATLGDAGYGQVTISPSGFRSLAATSQLFLYMTGNGTLSYTPLASGSGVELDHDQTAPSELAADDAAVFWATDSETDHAVLRSRAFTAGASTKLATGLDHPNGIALDDTYVYVTVRGTPPSYTNGAVVRVPRAGGAIERLADGLLLPYAIVVTDRFVIWTSRGTSTDGVGYTGGAIYRLAK